LPPQFDECSNLPAAPSGSRTPEEELPAEMLQIRPPGAEESSPDAPGAESMTLDLPPSRQTVRTRCLSLVAAGHAAAGGCPIFEDLEGDLDGTPVVLKELVNEEWEAYRTLSADFKDDALHGFVPAFAGVCESFNTKGEVIQMIRMSNLLHGFKQPKVIDVKLGVRTFLESECINKKMRADLFARAEKMYPSELLEEEKEAKGMTKHRWMTIRDMCTTIGTMGYRIDGIAGYKHRTKQDIDAELASFRTMEDTSECFRTFVEESARSNQAVASASPLQIAETLLRRLRKIREASGSSEFVKCNEFIGSSLLIIADSTGNAGASWIDFAKTLPIEKGKITHLDPWEVGNHEDGVLLGMDNLIVTFEKMVEVLRSSGSETTTGITNGISEDMPRNV